MHILVQAVSSYDLAVSTSIIKLIKDRIEGLVVTLLIPPQLKNGFPDEWKIVYNRMLEVEHPQTSRVRFNAIISTLRYKKTIKNILPIPDVILLGAWRHLTTNILAKHYRNKSRLVACKQGTDAPSHYYDRPLIFRTFYDFVASIYFGYSFLIYRGPSYSEKDKPFKSNFWSCTWRKNPVHAVIDLSESNEISPGKNEFILPSPLPLLKDLYSLENHEENILYIVGERTPLTGNWNELNQANFDSIMKEVSNKFLGWKILVRGRVGLTEIEKYKLPDFEIIDNTCYLEDQLLRIRPSLIISAKSTASKIGFYLQIPSVIYYPALDISGIENDLIGYFFLEVPSLLKISNSEQISPNLVTKCSKYKIPYNLAEMYLEVLLGIR